MEDVLTSGGERVGVGGWGREGVRVCVFVYATEREREGERERERESVIKFEGTRLCAQECVSLLIHVCVSDFMIV